MYCRAGSRVGTDSDRTRPASHPRISFISLLDTAVQSAHSASMNTMPSFLRRDVANIKPWTETCGQIRPLIEEKDGAAAEVHHLEISNAKLHYHERTDEIYYVLAGSGRMRLDD